MSTYFVQKDPLKIDEQVIYLLKSNQIRSSQNNNAHIDITEQFFEVFNQQIIECIKSRGYSTKMLQLAILSGNFGRLLHKVCVFVIDNFGIDDIPQYLDNLQTILEPMKGSPDFGFCMSELIHIHQSLELAKGFL